MKSLAEQFFFGAFIELVSLMLSYIFKDKPRIAILIFALGTVLAGFIAFNPFSPPDTPNEPTTEAISTEKPTVSKPVTSATPVPTKRPTTSTALSIPYSLYSTNFQSGVDSQWSTTFTSQSPSGEKFLGENYNQTVSLRLTDLPPHSEITIAYDLYIIGSWDGTYPSDVDLWQLKVDNNVIVNTTFDNQEFYEDHLQAFPDSYPNGTNLPRTGADENNSLGYGLGDSVYSMRYVIEHKSNSVLIEFIASNLEGGIADESWGIDNVTVNITK